MNFDTVFTTFNSNWFTRENRPHRGVIVNTISEMNITTYSVDELLVLNNCLEDMLTSFKKYKSEEKNTVKVINRKRKMVSSAPYVSSDKVVKAVQGLLTNIDGCFERKKERILTNFAGHSSSLRHGQLSHLAQVASDLESYTQLDVEGIASDLESQDADMNVPDDDTDAESAVSSSEDAISDAESVISSSDDDTNTALNSEGAMILANVTNPTDLELDLHFVFDANQPLFDEAFIMELLTKALENARFDTINEMLDAQMLLQLEPENRIKCLADICNCPKSDENIDLVKLNNNFVPEEDDCEELISMIENKKSKLLLMMMFDKGGEPHYFYEIIKKLDSDFVLNILLDCKCMQARWKHRFSLLFWAHKAGAKVTDKELTFLLKKQDYDAICKFAPYFDQISESDVVRIKCGKGLAVNINLVAALCKNKFQNQEELLSYWRGNLERILQSDVRKLLGVEKFNSHLPKFFGYLISWDANSLTSEEIDSFITIAMALNLQQFIIDNLENLKKDLLSR